MPDNKVGLQEIADYVGYDPSQAGAILQLLAQASKNYSGEEWADILRKTADSLTVPTGAYVLGLATVLKERGY